MSKDVLQNQLVEKQGFRFYQLYVDSSSYDISVVVTPNLTTAAAHKQDPDLYGSFHIKYPTAISPDVFHANRPGSDILHFCGSSNGKFPRGMNESDKLCTSPSSEYLKNTPGYLYLSVFGFTEVAFSIHVDIDGCQNETCSGHGQCGKFKSGICACERFWSGPKCSVNTIRCRECTVYHKR